ncbi:MAG: hypothetical protein PCFJNLEI_04133 [Verrucomicrobiae bacterium]|nr:hypothetical protein [Verrucomicrobiae bacterium]
MRLKAIVASLVGIFVASIGMVFADTNALNVAEWQSAREILVRAKQRILEKGWQQGATEPVAKECMTTAMENAWKDLGKSLVDFEYSCDALSSAIGLPRSPITMANDPLDIPYWGRNFMYWNDKPGRTAKEVLAAFDKAVAIAEKKKTAAIKAKVPPDALNDFDAAALKAAIKN